MLKVFDFSLFILFIMQAYFSHNHRIYERCLSISGERKQRIVGRDGKWLAISFEYGKLFYNNMNLASLHERK